MMIQKQSQQNVFKLSVLLYQTYSVQWYSEKKIKIINTNTHKQMQHVVKFIHPAVTEGGVHGQRGIFRRTRFKRGRKKRCGKVSVEVADWFKKTKQKQKKTKGGKISGHDHIGCRCSNFRYFHITYSVLICKFNAWKFCFYIFSHY